MTNLAAFELDVFLPHPPAKVWRVLTEPELMDAWLMPTDGYKPVVGTRFRFTTRPEPQIGFSGVIDCEVLEVSLKRLLRISWCSTRPAIDSVVTWELVPEGTGTRMLFSHTGFDLDDSAQAHVFELMARGRWNVLRRLSTALDQL